jgi:hypothetical protein
LRQLILIGIDSRTIIFRKIQFYLLCKLIYSHKIKNPKLCFTLWVKNVNLGIINMSFVNEINDRFIEVKTLDGFAGAMCIDKNGNIAHRDSFPTMVFASFDGKDLEVFK